MEYERINELKKIISVLRWDLNILKNKDLKTKKEQQLKLYEQELEMLLKQFKETVDHSAS